jgi:choline oxidase
MNADVVVVGGGTSGAVLARRLAEDPAINVILVESGPSDEGRADILLLREWMSLADDATVSVSYAIEPQTQANSSLIHSRGRVLGGCSSHNAAIALRPPDADLARWAEVAGEDWAPARIEQSWERMYATVGIGASETHNPLAAAVVEAGREAGLPLIETWGREPPRGIGWVPLNARGGRRRSSSVAYLHPLSELPENLTVLTDTSVERVELEDDGAVVGVLTSRGRIGARSEVVLCAGAFETPKLLMLSGIGPAEELAAHGLPVLVDLPGVGAHLLDHPETTMTWRAKRDVPDEGDQFWEVAAFEDTERGPVMAHVGTKPVVPAGYPLYDHGLSITPNAALPQSEGTVRLRSARADDPPRVDPQYLSDAGGHDLAALIEGLRLARRITAAPALAAWLGEEVAPGSACESEPELERYIRATLSTVHHPAGTARMGDPNDDRTVVNSQLRVRGVSGLSVADASIFPELPRVNPCLMCMMVGERAAEIVSRSLRAGEPGLASGECR